MLRFKQYIQERAMAKNVNDLNTSFMQRALTRTSFNLTAKDFESTTYKREIQFLFKQHLVPKFDLNKCLDKVNELSLRKAISSLKNSDRAGFTSIYKYNIKGIGPGEVLLYFLLNNAHLGGGASAGVDLVDNGAKYEIKAVDLTADGKYVSNFKTGGTFNTTDIISKAVKLKNAVKAQGEGVNQTAINMIKAKMPAEWNKLEKEYQKRAYDNYFKQHQIIFINNKPRNLGEIIAIKKVKQSDIAFERVTSGVIKPRVLVK